MARRDRFRVQAYSALAIVATPNVVRIAAVTRLRIVVTRGRRSQVTARAAREAITRSQAKATAVSIMPSVRTVEKSDACDGTNCGTIARKNRPTLGLSAHDIRPEQNAAAGARSAVERSEKLAVASC